MSQSPSIFPGSSSLSSAGEARTPPGRRQDLGLEPRLGMFIAKPIGPLQRTGRGERFPDPGYSRELFCLVRSAISPDCHGFVSVKLRNLCEESGLRYPCKTQEPIPIPAYSMTPSRRVLCRIYKEAETLTRMGTAYFSLGASPTINAKRDKQLQRYFVKAPPSGHHRPERPSPCSINCSPSSRRS